jgi:hypothetical protein
MGDFFRQRLTYDRAACKLEVFYYRRLSRGFKDGVAVPQRMSDSVVRR